MQCWGKALAPFSILFSSSIILFFQFLNELLISHRERPWGDGYYDFGFLCVLAPVAGCRRHAQTDAAVSGEQYKHIKKYVRHNFIRILLFYFLLSWRYQGAGWWSWHSRCMRIEWIGKKYLSMKIVNERVSGTFKLWLQVIGYCWVGGSSLSSGSANESHSKRSTFDFRGIFALCLRVMLANHQT